MAERHEDEDIANRILLSLPRASLQAIRPHLELVQLPRGQVVYHSESPIRRMYFINRGLVSLVRTMRNGRSVEIGAVGLEGVTGPDALFGIDRAILESIVQIPGTAFRIDPNILRKEMKRSDTFRRLFQRYVHLAVSQIAQTAACNRLHTLEERCCRWLLIAHDGARSDTFPLTHEFLAMMLGAQRAGVSLAANSLQRAGLIRYSRGRMTVTNRAGLEAAACECDGTIRALIDHLFGPARLP